MKRKPTSPGEILNEEFLKPLGITQKQLAEHLGCDYKVIKKHNQLDFKVSSYRPAWGSPYLENPF